MPRPDWGMKRTCQSCGVRFYDLLRDPIHCPKCGSLYDPEAVLKSRRTRAVAEKSAPKLAVVKDDLEIDAVDVTLEDEPAAKEAEEDEELMEDTSELGADDDVAQVIDTVDEEER